MGNCAIGATGGGHAIVGDGYGYSPDGSLYIHFNFGYGAATVEAFRNPSLEPLGSVEFTAGDGRFSSGGAATATFPKVANFFFNAKIVE